MKVANVYAGQHVFLTGATGFVGQAVLAKLLQVAPDVAQVYALIRGSGGVSGQQRFDALLDTSSIFQFISQTDEVGSPEAYRKLVKSKVTVVQGDLSTNGESETYFGLSKQRCQALRNDVTIILHSAANVAFTNPFVTAITDNLLSTVMVQDFAKTCTKLHTFCYVSTAYVGANSLKVIQNAEFIPLPFNINHLVHAAKKNDASLLKRYELAMRGGGWPNTYVMSKVCAESYLHQNRGDLPTLIIRPSMVGCAYWDSPGWNLSKGGPTLSTFAIGMGVASILPSTDYSLDIVPVDYVANSVVTSSAYFDQLPAADKDHVHIHFSAMGLHRLPQDLFYSVVLDHYRENPLKGRLREPRLRVCHSDSHFRREKFLRYIVPLLGIKTATKVWSGTASIKPVRQLQGMLRKVLKLYRISDWVLTREFIFVEGGEKEAREALSDEREKKLLRYDLKDLDHTKYTELFCSSITQLLAPKEMRLSSNL